MNRRLRARITRNAMISTRNPSTVPPHTFASLETFVRSRHHRGRRGRRGPSSRSPARVVIHFIRTACTRARRSTWGGIHDESRPINTTFRVFFLPKRSKKKKSSTPARPTAWGWGIHTRVMTHHRERDTYKKSHARGPMQSRSRGKKKQKHKTPTAGGEVCVGDSMTGHESSVTPPTPHASPPPTLPRPDPRAGTSRRPWRRVPTRRVRTHRPPHSTSHESAHHTTPPAPVPRGVPVPVVVVVVVLARVSSSMTHDDARRGRGRRPRRRRRTTWTTRRTRDGARVVVVVERRRRTAADAEREGRRVVAREHNVEKVGSIRGEHRPVVGGGHGLLGARTRGGRRA